MTTCISSGDIDEDTQLYVGRGTLNSVTVTTTDTNAASVKIYDTASGQPEGNLLASVRITGNNNRTHDKMFTTPVRCLNGLFVEVSGEPNDIIVYYGG